MLEDDEIIKCVLCSVNIKYGDANFLYFTDDIEIDEEEVLLCDNCFIDECQNCGRKNTDTKKKLII